MVDSKARLKTAVVALLAVVALVASACAGSSTTDVATGAATNDGPKSFDDLEYRSPIGEYLGVDFTDSDAMQSEFSEMEREAERLTAECMAEKGFEYSPRDNNDMVIFGPGGPGGDELPYFSSEWVDKYGFGITTQRFPQSMVGDLVGRPDESMSGPGEGPDDPNQLYVDSLSEGERDAYYEALNGDFPEFGPEGPDEDFVFEPSGCQFESMDAAFGNGPDGEFEGFIDAFGDELEALEQRLDSDPAMINYTNEVSNCVSDAGMSYVDEQDLYERFERRLSQVQPGAMMGGDPFEAAGLDPETMSDRQIEEFFTELNRLDADGLAVLAELQAEELALARVVVDCGGGPLNEQAFMIDIRVKYEQEFLDRNADAMAEFKADG